MDSTLLATTRANAQALGFAMPDSVAIQHITGYVATSQGTTPTYSTPIVVKGRWAQLSGSELERARQVSAEATTVLTLPANTDVRVTDALSVTVAETAELIPLEVVYVVERTQAIHTRVYCKEFITGPTPSLIQRAQAAIASPGWRELGQLPAVGLHFRESDILYNADDALYYVFNTEGDGNPHPTAGVWNIQGWVGNGTTATVTLSQAHDIPVGTVWVVKFTGATALSGSVGNLTGAAGRFCKATSTTTFSIASTTANGIGNTAGTAARSTGSNPQVGMRRSSTLEGLSGAAGADQVTRVASSLYYPTVVKVGSGASSVWYMFGTSASGMIRKSYAGAVPLAMDAFGTGTGTILATTTVPTYNVPGDPHVTKHPTLVPDTWYMVCVTSPEIDPDHSNVVQIFSNTNLATDTWALVTANAFADIGLPSWAANGIPDPSLAFVDGHVYLFFSGSADGAPGTFSCGMVELDPVTYKAIGSAVLLQRYDQTETWQNGALLSDLTYMLCPDGIERIFAFCNGNYDGLGQGVWGCLDLPTFI